MPDSKPTGGFDLTGLPAEQALALGGEVGRAIMTAYERGAQAAIDILRDRESLAEFCADHRSIAIDAQAAADAVDFAASFLEVYKTLVVLAAQRGGTL